MEEIAKIEEIIFLEKISTALVVGGIIVLVGICLSLFFLYLGIENEKKRKL